METLLRILDWPMPKPEMYGWFHQLWLMIPFFAAWLLCRMYHHSPRPQAFVRQVVFRTAVLVAVLELLHQINYNLIWQDGALRLDMQWYAFPFQFCTTPMYAGLLTGVFKKGRVHDALCAYLATYAVFAGLAVMLYPNTIFTGTIITNIHGMVCHASMLTMGIFLYYTGHVKAERRTLLRAIPVFSVFVMMAMVMNEIAYRAGLMDMGHTFNMFFISPHCEPSLPVYSTVQAHVAYPWCLLIYISVFTLAAYLMLLFAMSIVHAARNRRPHHPLPA
ncbi:MAG: YwaF family protein [Clostridia bacterium]|nr:YwaF family protein [Clostridia bacterium]